MSVETCSNYLKALEVMEYLVETDPQQSFIHFTALNYNRLAHLFLDHDAEDIAIECYANAKRFFKMENSLNSVVLMSQLIGGVYYQMAEYDSSLKYLNIADSINDIYVHNALFSRGNNKTKANVLFTSERDKDSAYKIIYKDMAYAENLDELMGYYVLLGYYYKEDEKYDSAIYYLEKSFSRNRFTMIDVSKFIVDICKITGDKKRLDYYSFLFTEEAYKEIKNVPTKIELTSLYEQYKKQKAEVRLQQNHYRNMIIIIVIIVVISIICSVLVLLLRRQKIKFSNKILEKDSHIKTVSDNADMISDDLQKKESEIQMLKQQLDNNVEYEKIDDALFEEKMSVLLSKPCCNELVSKFSNILIKTSSSYPELILSEKQQNNIIKEVNSVFVDFSRRLIRKYPKLKKTDIIYCCLYFIGFEEKHAAVLTGKEYSVVWRRTQKLQKIFDTKVKIAVALCDFIKNDK